MTPSEAPYGNLIRRLSIAVISSIALSLGSCASNAPSTNSDSPAQSPTAATTDELQVVTTFLPITQFTKAVAGDRAEVTQLLPTNVGPHDYQAKPEDAQRLAKADVLVQNGLYPSFSAALVNSTDRTCAPTSWDQVLGGEFARHRVISRTTHGLSGNLCSRARCFVLSGSRNRYGDRRS